MEINGLKIDYDTEYTACELAHLIANNTNSIAIYTSYEDKDDSGNAVSFYSIKNMDIPENREKWLVEQLKTHMEDNNWDEYNDDWERLELVIFKEKNEILLSDYETKWVHIINIPQSLINVPKLRELWKKTIE